MKKLYSILTLALAVCASASAETLTLQTSTTPALRTLPYAKKSVNVDLGLPAKAPKKAAPQTIDEICHEYTYTYVYPFPGYEGTSPGTCTITKIDDTIVAISGIDMKFGNLFAPLKAEVDLSAGTLTVKSQQVYTAQKVNANPFRIAESGKYERCPDGEGMVMNINEDGSITPAPYKVTINGKEYTKDTYAIFYQDPSAVPAYAGGYTGFVDLKFMPVETFEEPEMTGWSTVGQGVLNDAWMKYRMANDVTDFPNYNVTIQRNDADPNIYRILNPFGGLNDMEGNDINLSSVGGQIVFDITVPTCVLIKTGYYSGFYNNKKFQIGKLYCYNFEDLLATSNNVGAATVEAAFKRKGYTPSSFDAETNTVTIHNALFGISADPMAGYSWSDANGNPIDDMTGLIVIPVDETNALGNIILNPSKAIFYNLQGQRVDNPSDGIYIRVQGKETRKVYVR